MHSHGSAPIGSTTSSRNSVSDRPGPVGAVMGDDPQQQSLSFDPEPAEGSDDAVYAESVVVDAADTPSDRVVRVRPDEPAIDKTFDYLVPASMVDSIRVGSIVRVPLHGRRMAGWVVADDVTPPPGVQLQSITKVSGWGPPPELFDVAEWAAWRWAGRPATVLRTASPPTVVRGLPRPP